MLNDPDPAACKWMLFFSTDDDACRCICLGLVPSGAWSAIATHSVHSPRIPPEVREIVGALGESSPLMASLGDAVHSLSLHSKMERVLKVALRVASVLCSLQTFLSRISDGPT